MAERRRVGILFINRNTEWAGGNYYIYNLMLALKTLPDHDVPHLVIFTHTPSDFELVLKETNYPYIEFLPLEIAYSFTERVINKLSRIFFKKNSIIKRYSGQEAEALFPYKHYESLNNFATKIYWIADFQEHYLPHFFTQDLLESRRKHQEFLASGKHRLVLSSKDALNDFERFYPRHQCEVSILNFAVTHPDFEKLNLNELLKYYKIKQPYFFSSNQFWAHKNHIIVLKAAKILKEKGLDFTIAFSGKESDSRNPDYFKGIKDFVVQNHLQNNIHFLGFMDRTHQLKLMKNAVAAIQPSLFEGWSTVVEDAKAMEQFIIVSDLKVHREQLSSNADFFDPNNELQLAELMEKRLLKQDTLTPIDYKQNIRNFGKLFMDILTNKDQTI